jgi:hypothetical protein
LPRSYVGSLTDFSNSVLGHPERWARVASLLAEGHNVVLLANHQTEADPGVFAHMLAAAHPNLATDVIYVAGGMDVWVYGQSESRRGQSVVAQSFVWRMG